ncbi:MAG: hypothetical protein HN542_05720 [Flavobacteriales bacterium]|jgi:hypothetical protein|nr:hypothetical protein [Flavobacteriales bacterium]NCG29836.1 hypothetical protein [Bacteroidota bacterium]MBT3964489.1 hypothetical protein [Flavobacteriales bacterium]MBT4705727.1 hypothetical protein [Flavobacteriales bacterium]MBT4931003.1 hypothetical protein [Flavobacteriales bacterium]
MKTKTLLFLLSLIASFSIVSCRKDLKLASWDVDVIAPLAQGKIDLSSLIKSKHLVADNAGLYHLQYSDTLFRIGLDTLIGIPDTTITNEFVIPIGNITFPPGVVFYRDTNRIRYKLKEIGLTFAEIRESLISVELQNTIDERILFRYSILSATLDGDTFKVEEMIDANSTFETQYDLDGYDINFTGLNGDKTNTIITNVEIMIDPAASAPHTFSAGDKFGIDLTFKKIIPEYTRGYFGQQQTLFSDSTAIDLLPNIDFDMIDLTEFSVKMKIDNGVGADLQLSLDRIGSFNSTKNQSVDLSHSVIGSKLQFSRAIDLHPTVEDVKHILKEFEFNETNSNLDELLELKPDAFIFDLDLEINPFGNVSLGNDFVRYGHDLSATLEVDVPLKVGVKGLVLSDTFEFNISDSTDQIEFKPLNDGRLILYLENGFPIEGTIQFILLDEESTALDSLFETPAVIASGVPIGIGSEIDASESVIELLIDQERMDRFNEAKQIVFKGNLSTHNKEVINIYNNGTMEFRLIADVNLNTR